MSFNFKEIVKIKALVYKGPKNVEVEDENEKHRSFMIPLGQLWSKGVNISTWVTPIKKLHVFLRNLIFDGKAKPSFIVTDRVSIDDASQAYSQFDEREDVIKPIIKFDDGFSK